MKTYRCCKGHEIQSKEDLVDCYCPACMGPIVNVDATEKMNLPGLLNLVT